MGSCSRKLPHAGSILRQMRKSLGISQLELSLRLGISQRHIGFVELGRARPSISLILSWTRETAGSVDERNAALISTGYSPASLELDGNAVAESPALLALSDMLAAHEPYPGLIFDADWMVRGMSQGGQWLCSILLADIIDEMAEPVTGLDMIGTVAHADGFLSKACNAREAGHALLRQLRTEELTRPALKPRVDDLEESLRSRYGDGEWSHRAPGDTHLQLVFDTEFGQLTFLLVQTVFGLPQNITQKSLRTELWFPVDDRTRRVMATNGLRPLPAHAPGMFGNMFKAIEASRQTD